MENRVKLSIAGTDYVITSDEMIGYTEDLGRQVDQAMRSILSGNPRTSTAMAAVLAALDFADKAAKANATCDNLRTQMKDYLEDSAKSRQSCEAANREVERLRQELSSMRQRMSQKNG